MANHILLANSSQSEIRALSGLLEPRYSIQGIESISAKPADYGKFDLILIDANFTDQQGLDFLMEVNAAVDVPVLILTPPEDQKCSVEALRLGATNYLVKAPNVLDVLPLAIDEAIDRFGTIEHLKQTIIGLKQRIGELEAALKRRSSKAQAGAPDSVGQPSKLQALRIAVLNYLQSGNVNLPAYPQISAKLAALMERDPSIGEVVALLQEDVAVSAKLISVSNTIRYRGNKPVQTLEQAVARLGMRDTQNHADLIANRGIYKSSKKEFRLRLEKLWMHAMVCAHSARSIGLRTHSADPNELFSMGLLHDIGQLLLLQVISALESGGALKAAVSEDELDQFLSQNHAGCGERLLQIWKLPKPFGDVARFHESPDQSPVHSPELQIVAFADRLAQSLGYAETGTQAPPDLTRDAAALGLDEAVMMEIRSEVQQLAEASSIKFD
jgi:HD-like signal output (HDOD) protein/DNA-binding NarL/FixJ family response regulator